MNVEARVCERKEGRALSGNRTFGFVYLLVHMRVRAGRADVQLMVSLLPSLLVQPTTW